MEIRCSELKSQQSLNSKTSNFGLRFLPREATRSAVLPWQVVCPSVRPSVRL